MTSVRLRLRLGSGSDLGKKFANCAMRMHYFEIAQRILQTAHIDKSRQEYCVYYYAIFRPHTSSGFRRGQSQHTPPRLVQNNAKSVIRGRWFSSQNASGTVCQSGSSARPAGELTVLPNASSWMGGPQRGIQKDGKQKGDGGREEGIYGKEREG